MRVFIPVLLVFIIIACQNGAQQSSPVVASVAGKVLTVNDIEEIIYNESGLEISSAQVYRYVQRWIETELVYQEALEQGLQEEPAVQKRLRDLEKDYLVNLFLDRYDNVEILLTDQDIQDYYEQNKAEFIREEDYYYLYILLAENYRSANTLRRELLAGGDFAALARDHSLDPSKDNGGLLGWTKLSDVNESVATRVPSLGMNVLSSPIKSDAGYYIVKVTDVRKKGEIMSIDEVRETIVFRLKTERKNEKYRNLITSLGEKYEMSSNLELLKRFEGSAE